MLFTHKHRTTSSAKFFLYQLIVVSFFLMLGQFLFRALIVTYNTNMYKQILIFQFLFFLLQYVSIKDYYCY
jgi:hypothetical protein